MADESKVYEVIIRESEEIVATHGIPRRTEMLAGELDMSTKDLVHNQRSVGIIIIDFFLNLLHFIIFLANILCNRCVVSLSADGYIKRMTTADFARAGGVVAGTDQTYECNTLDNVIFITTRCVSPHDKTDIYLIFETHMLYFTCRGVARALKAFNIPLVPRGGRGVPIPQLKGSCAKGDVVACMRPIDTGALAEDGVTITSDAPHGGVLLLSAAGRVKRTAIEILDNCEKRKRSIVKVKEGDAVRWALMLPVEHDILIVTRYIDMLACSLLSLI